MSELALSEGKVYFEIHGEGEPVIALHDGAGSTKALKWQVPEFGKHFTFVVYDRLGHGRSEHRGRYETQHLEKRAAELKELIADLGFDCVHLCGICEGGAVALIFASLWPAFVKTLILSSVGYHATQDTIARCELYFQPWAELDAALQDRMVEYHGKDYAMLKWEALREAKHYVWDPSYDLRPRFPDVKAPTLVMGGDRDPFFGLEHPIEAHTGIRDAELCILPGAGHFANEENPAVFNQVVINFIMRQIGRSRQEGSHHEGSTARP